MYFRPSRKLQGAMNYKFLIISLLYPLPENTGGRMRTMNFVRFFKKYGDIDLLYLSLESKQLENSGFFRKEHCIPTSDDNVNPLGNKGDTRRRRFRERWKRMAERRPSILMEWSPKAVEGMVSLLTKERYNIILCRYINNSFPFFQLPVEIRKRIIIDFDDVYSDANFSTSNPKTSNLFMTSKYFIEKLLVNSYQKRCLNFGAALVCSEKDHDALSMNRKYRNLFTIPNSYPINRGSARFDSKGYDNRNVFLFVGTLNYGPNANGLEWFIEEIFPEIQKKKSSSKLLIVGRDPEERLISWCSRFPGIELYANVPDVGPFYERCGIVVVPILSGGGTRIKILEAAKAGKPVFSTPIGAYGLDVTDGKDIMIFTDRESFIERYERLNVKETYENIKNNLSKIVELKYTPEAFENEMKKVMNFII